MVRGWVPPAVEEQHGHASKGTGTGIQLSGHRVPPEAARERRKGRGKDEETEEGRARRRKEGQR